MKAFKIFLISLFLSFFVINIVYEYVHVLHLKKIKDVKNSSNKVLLQLFLHLNIIKEITVTAVNNLLIRVQLIIYSLYIYVTFKEREHLYSFDFKGSPEVSSSVILQEMEDIIPRDEKGDVIYKNLMSEKDYTIKTIYFIRHSESVWNQAFNKGLNFRKACNILLLFFYELFFLFSRRSVLFDSPLSVVGIIQSLELSNFLKNEKDMNNENRNNQCVRKDREFLLEGMKHSDPLNEFYHKLHNRLSNASQYSTNPNPQQFTSTKMEMKKDSVYNDSKEDRTHVELPSNTQRSEGLHQRKEVVEKYSPYNPEEIINLSLKDHIEVLNNRKYKSTILTSNLRRAISSCYIGFYNRIHRFHEPIHVMSSLKEISRNPDCIPLVQFYRKFITTDMEKLLHKDVQKFYETNVKMVQPKKKQKRKTKINRFLETLDYIFENDNNIFIVFGHSNWIRRFFNCFLKSNHKAKTHKLQNSAIILFNVIKYKDSNDNVHYEILKNSIRVIYKGFEERLSSREII